MSIKIELENKKNIFSDKKTITTAVFTTPQSGADLSKIVDSVQLPCFLSASR